MTRVRECENAYDRQRNPGTSLDVYLVQAKWQQIVERYVEQAAQLRDIEEVWKKEFLMVVEMPRSELNHLQVWLVLDSISIPASTTPVIRSLGTAVSILHKRRANGTRGEANSTSASYNQSRNTFHAAEYQVKARHYAALPTSARSL